MAAVGYGRLVLGAGRDNFGGHFPMNDRSRLRDASDSVEQLAQKPGRGAPALDQESSVVGHSQPVQALSGRMRRKRKKRTMKAVSAATDWLKG